MLMLKTILIASFAITIAFGAYLSPSHAQTNCTTVGNQVFCNNGSGGSYTCTRVGQQKFCN